MTTKITEQNISNLANIGVQWQSVFTGDGSTGLTAVAGRGYFIDTTSGTVTVTLPASPSAGDVVVLKDYARTWNTNNVTTASALFDGVSLTNTFSTSGQTITLVYMDGTKGWSLINEDTTTGLGANYITATGGTVTTSGDYKIHSFTGDGCFVVSSLGNPAGGGSSVDYLVVAGGGGGAGPGAGGDSPGGGGAGGFRESSGTASGCYTASPLSACVAALPVSVTTYPVTVGGGGSGSVGIGNGTQGSNSVFSTITSTGGGFGRYNDGTRTGGSGGSGGGPSGGFNPVPAGSGNTPPTSPPQGNPGTVNNQAPDHAGGGGGGAGGAGQLGISSCRTGDGGAAVTTSIRGSATTYAGGGGGGGTCSGPYGGGGGRGGGETSEPLRGGGGPGGSAGVGGNCGIANTGGGGGGAGTPGGPASGAGGKGIVVIRYKFQ